MTRRFEIADPDGVLLILDEDEARRMVDELRSQDEPLSPPLESMVSQLEEWLT